MSDPHSAEPEAGGTLQGAGLPGEAHLLVTWPDGRTQPFSLGEGVRIGRRSDCNEIVVPAEYSSVSGVHCAIRLAEGRYTVTDLGSSNGTFVNGQRIEPDDALALNHGDEVQVGLAEYGQQVRLVVQISQELETGFRPAVVPATAYQAPSTPDAPHLAVRWPNGQEATFALEKDSVLLGRSPAADFVFPPSLAFVSARHARIERRDGDTTITDLNSTNGTRVNNRLIFPERPHPLHDGDIVRIGDEQVGASVGLTFYNPAEAHALPFEGFASTGFVGSLIPARPTTLGRDPGCDIVLDSPNVSRQHAVVEATDGGHRIRDLGSMNGTRVNGELVQSAALAVGDVVQIGHFLLAYDGQTLARFDSQGMRLDVVDLYKEVRTPSGPLRILDDINMTILPREFVALVGGSGAGKSTLMDALNGFRPASGTVLINGRELYRNYNSFRTQMGYVPQHDILHTSLPVEKALDYSARLRLPLDVTRRERQERIGQVLETVGMNTAKVRRLRISKLSGGQRKRVSIAAELLAEPKLFFLDEPTSGLDPGLEKKMMHTMRQMADEGRTVVLITHATANITQVDHVSLLSQGKMVYFGPPQESLSHFQVGEFADIYDKIELHGDRWHRYFKEEKPDLYRAHILGRKGMPQIAPGAADQPRAFRLSPLQLLNQFAVLTQRMFNIILSEPLTMIILLAVMPLVATFLLTVAPRTALVGNPNILANPAEVARKLTENYLPAADAQPTLYAMALLAVLVGLYGASNELIKERSVYLRERMINLKLGPYIFSKLFVFSWFAIVQVILFLIVLSLDIDLPEQGQFLPAPLEMFITMFIATMAAVALGLFISSISSSASMSVYIILVVLFVQIIFSGASFPLRGKPVEALSYATLTRWTLMALGTTADMNELAEGTVVCGNAVELVEDSLQVNPATGQINTDAIEFRETSDPACSNRPVEPEDLSVPYGDSFLDLLGLWVVLGAFGFVFTVATLVTVKRLDST